MTTRSREKERCARAESEGQSLGPPMDEVGGRKVGRGECGRPIAHWRDTSECVPRMLARTMDRLIAPSPQAPLLTRFRWGICDTRIILRILRNPLLTKFPNYLWYKKPPQDIINYMKCSEKSFPWSRLVAYYIVGLILFPRVMNYCLL